jgi:hypothetical protein
MVSGVGLPASHAPATCWLYGGMTSILDFGNFTFAGQCSDSVEGFRVVEPKTRSSRRTVVLPRLATRHLQEHHKRQGVERPSARPHGSRWSAPLDERPGRVGLGLLGLSWAAPAPATGGSPPTSTS